MINMRQYMEGKLKPVCKVGLDIITRKGTLTFTVLKYKYCP